MDYVSRLVDEKYAGLLKKDAAVDVYTTLDLHLQRLAQEAVAEGMAQVDKTAGRAASGKGQAQAALVAVDPRTGEILALVGGRVVQPVAVQPRGRRRSASRDRSSSRSSISRRSRHGRRGPSRL